MTSEYDILNRRRLHRSGTIPATRPTAMRGKLLTQDYLDEGITETAAWRDLTPLTSGPSRPASGRSSPPSLKGGIGEAISLFTTNAGRSYVS